MSHDDDEEGCPCSIARDSARSESPGDQSARSPKMKIATHVDGCGRREEARLGVLRAGKSRSRRRVRVGFSWTQSDAEAPRGLGRNPADLGLRSAPGAGTDQLPLSPPGQPAQHEPPAGLHSRRSLVRRLRVGKPRLGRERLI
jgi:hypothetical protein